MRGLPPHVRWGPEGVSANRSLPEQTVIAAQTDTITTLSASVRFIFHSCFLFCTFVLSQICHWCLKMRSHFIISCLRMLWHKSFLGLLQQQPSLKPCIVSLSGGYVNSQRLDECCNLTGVRLVCIMSLRPAQCTCEEGLLWCSALEASFIEPQQRL